MSVQKNINQALTLTAGAVALTEKNLNDEADQEVAKAIEGRDLAKSRYEKAESESDLESLKKSLTKQQKKDLEEDGIPLISEMSPERELDYKNKYSKQGIIGKHKLAERYREDQAVYEYNQALRNSYRSNILDMVEKNKQIKRDSLARAREVKKQKREQMNEVNKK